MQSRIGHLLVETIAAESPKFTAPMLCVHGLWCTAAVWRRFMGFCTHRGWTCTALNLRGRARGEPQAIGRVRFADYLDDLRQVIAACETPPVLVGHDLGALLALHCDAPAVRAIVALAPLVPRAAADTPNRALASVRARLAMWRHAPLPPPRGDLGAAYLGAARSASVPDSSAVARALRDGRIAEPGTPHVPTLVIAGKRDPFSPPAAVAQLAQTLGASFRVAEDAGHAMPWDSGWERRVSEVHRWLVRALGDPLLIERADDEE